MVSLKKEKKNSFCSTQYSLKLRGLILFYHEKMKVTVAWICLRPCLFDSIKFFWSVNRICNKLSALWGYKKSQCFLCKLKDVCLFKNTWCFERRSLCPCSLRGCCVQKILSGWKKCGLFSADYPIWCYLSPWKAPTSLWDKRYDL